MRLKNWKKNYYCLKLILKRHMILWIGIIWMTLWVKCCFLLFGGNGWKNVLPRLHQRSLLLVAPQRNFLWLEVCAKGIPSLPLCFFWRQRVYMLWWIWWWPVIFFWLQGWSEANSISHLQFVVDTLIFFL